MFSVRGIFIMENVFLKKFLHYGKRLSEERV